MSWLLIVATTAAATAAVLAAAVSHRVAATRARVLAHLRQAAPEITVIKRTPLGFVAEVLGVPVEVDLASLLRRRPRGADGQWLDQLLADLRARVPAPPPPPLALVCDRIMPLLRPQAHPDLFTRYPPALHLAWRPCAPGVVVTYVLAGLEAQVAVTRGWLDAWRLPVEALHAMAVDNLRRQTQHILAEIGGPRMRYEHLDGLDATRVLVADLVVPPGVRDPVAAIPEETVLLLAPAAQAVALAAEAAARHAASTRPLAAGLLRLTAAGPLPAGPLPGSVPTPPQRASYS
ncbi:MAG: hypothetical protein QN183_03170 [Armatimonadota bacterium]|nr:hypothetical protein [Armatimonadota bacterium]MDR7532733.1 hypothetical protein [Armatimonadota bacterium]MDR7535353.1 hypothetical protein [Armatimonadota bacterium]